MLQYNFDNIIFDLLPIELRTLGQFEWLHSLIKPLGDYKTDLNAYYNQTIYDALHNAQVLSLEHYLNEYYGLPFPQPAGHTVIVPPSIFITTGERFWRDRLFIFNKGLDAESSLNWNWLYGNGVNPSDPFDGQTYLFNKSEIVASPGNPNEDDDVVALYNLTEFENDEVDFIVLVYDNWLAGDLDKINEIHQIVEHYHIAGTSWVIMTYDSIGNINSTPIYYKP